MTNCPKCNAGVGNEAEQCPQCGILFSKWQQREENVASGNVARYSIANATSSEFNWVILAIVCVIVIAAFYFLEYNQ
jgi:uncharacterized membrane protein YvbJ